MERHMSQVSVRGRLVMNGRVMLWGMLCMMELLAIEIARLIRRYGSGGKISRQSICQAAL